MLGSWKGCLWIDLDERVVEPQRNHEEPQVVTVGGSWTIQTVSNLLYGEHFSLQNFIHSVSRCYSEKLFGFGALFLGIPPGKMSVYTSP